MMKNKSTLNFENLLSNGQVLLFVSDEIRERAGGKSARLKNSVPLQNLCLQHSERECAYCLTLSKTFGGGGLMKHRGIVCVLLLCQPCAETYAKIASGARKEFINACKRNGLESLLKGGGAIKYV